MLSEITLYYLPIALIFLGGLIYVVAATEFQEFLGALVGGGALLTLAFRRLGGQPDIIDLNLPPLVVAGMILVGIVVGMASSSWRGRGVGAVAVVAGLVTMPFSHLNVG